MEISLSIIGTAGRKDDAKRLSKKHFEAMCMVAEALINQCNISNYTITHLVSGGAAWADHVAVKLFLDGKAPHLRLFLPANFKDGSYEDNGDTQGKNPGPICNYYHKQFQTVAQVNSLSQILTAQARGAELIPVSGGFYGRNAMVAKSDFLLAMTFGNKNEVKEGGTADTVRRYLARVHKEGFFNKSFHYDLNSGEVFEGCAAPLLKKKENKTVVLSGIAQTFLNNQGTGVF